MSSPVGLAVKYLEGTQNSDGSWDAGDPLVCGRAIVALSGQCSSEAIIDRGIAYLEGCQLPDGHFPAKTAMYTDAASTAYSLVALNHFHYSKVSLPVSHGLIWLLETQQPDGSWNGRNVTKNAYTTSLCLRALHTYYLSGLLKYRKGVAHVQQKLAEPGFFDEPISHVYAPVLNLRRIDQLTPDVQDAFTGFASRHMTLSMEAGEIADIAYLCGTLGAIGESELYGKCARWLQSAGRADGGFGKDTRSESDPNWTALVLLSLGNKL